MMTEVNQKPKLVVNVPCSECDRVFKINIDEKVILEAERFPFPIILMHSASDDEQRGVHTLIAYIDEDLNTRHVSLLDGKRVFVTPYILYNPNLIALSCNKNIGGY